jgi:VanZ family protein
MDKRMIVFLFWICGILWLSLLIAGLWPFNFYPRNRVYWLQNENGLHFDAFAQTYSTNTWNLNPSAEANNKSFTIELWLRPGETQYPHLSAIVSIYGYSSTSNLNIAQSGPDLVVQGYFRNRDGGQQFHQLWMDDACRSSQPLFVTVTSSGEGTTLLWNGRSQHLKTYKDLLPETYIGRLVLGHAPDGNQPWTGDIFGLAIYDRAFSGDEIRDDYKDWVRSNRDQVGARALYAFDERSGALVHNLGGTAPNLVIPEHFRPLHPTVLEIPHPFTRSDVLDTLINILGFTPFGFFVCAYFRERQCSSRNAILQAIVFGFLTSIGIELLQVLLPSRDSSLLDVINNGLGTALGSILAVRSHALWRRMILRIIPIGTDNIESRTCARFRK